MKKGVFIRSGVLAISCILGNALPATAQRATSSKAVLQFEDVLPWILFIGALTFFFIVISIKQKIRSRRAAAEEKDKN